MRSSARIYGGGGGGEKGATGAQGATGLCQDTQTVQNCGSCPDCPTGWTSTSGCYSGAGCARVRRCNWWGSCWFITNGWWRYDDCLNEYQVLVDLVEKVVTVVLEEDMEMSLVHYKEIMVLLLPLIMVVTLLKDNQAKQVVQEESGHSQVEILIILETVVLQEKQLQEQVIL